MSNQVENNRIRVRAEVLHGVESLDVEGWQFAGAASLFVTLVVLEALCWLHMSNSTRSLFLAGQTESD